MVGEEQVLKKEAEGRHEMPKSQETDMNLEKNNSELSNETVALRESRHKQ